MHAPVQPHHVDQLPNNKVSVFSLSCLLGIAAFSEYFYITAVPSFVDYLFCRLPCTFSFWIVFFYLVTTGWILTSSACVRVQLIDQSWGGGGK